MSPDSFWAASRESTYTRARRSTSSSSSRQSGRGAPRALMCTPGESHSPDSTAVVEVVAVTTTSAPRTASSAELAARTPCSSANTAARRGLHTLTSRKSRTSLSVARCDTTCKRNGGDPGYNGRGHLAHMKHVNKLALGLCRRNPSRALRAYILNVTKTWARR
jgi:hypothetical protein